MQWIFKKKNIFKRAIFYFEIGKKCYTLFYQFKIKKKMSMPPKATYLLHTAPYYIFLWFHFFSRNAAWTVYFGCESLSLYAIRVVYLIEMFG